MLIAAPLAGKASSRLKGNASGIPNSEAHQLSEIYKKEFNQEPVERTLLVTKSSTNNINPEFQKSYAALLEKIKTVKGVKAIARFDSGFPIKQVSEDGSITVSLIDTDFEDANQTLSDLRAITHAEKIPGTELYITGATAVTDDFLEQVDKDIGRSETRAFLPIALVLLLAFGALVATGLPLAVGAVSIALGMAVLYILTLFGEVSSFAKTSITMLALGAGIDYALIIVNRFREELSKGSTPKLAANITAKTAGRAVAFSGLVVAIAMSALLIPNLVFIRSMGMGGVLSMLFTILVSVTLLPAILTLLGERVNSPRRLAFKTTSSGHVNPFWGRWATVVMRHPWLSAILVMLVMGGLALPTLQMKLGYAGPFGLTSEVESRKGFELIRTLELGGAMDTFELLFDLGEEGFSPQNRTRWRTLEQEISQWPEVRLVVSPFMARSSGQSGGLGDLVNLNDQYISENRKFLRLTVIPRDAVHAIDIRDWYEKFKSTSVEAGFTRTLVGGAPVGNMEFTDTITSSIPKAMGMVFVLTFFLLAAAFRSILIPIKSIIMNTFSVGAAYGIITLVFQKGYFAKFFGVPTDIGSVDASLPLIMFAMIFGLSMDYEIFLLSRVQELHLRGESTKNAVKSALERTGGIITSAAIIMIIVFSSFIMGNVVANKTIGLGLSSAVLLDASLIRLILVPSVMLLAGSWNWWLPKFMDRLLPKFKFEE